MGRSAIAIRMIIGPDAILALCRPTPSMHLSGEEVQQLQALENSRSLPNSIVQRAQIVLPCGACETNTAITKRIGRWHERWYVAPAPKGALHEGLDDELHPGHVSKF